MYLSLMDPIIQIFGAFVAIYAFAFLIETPRKYVFRAGIVGAVGGLVYIVSENLGMGVVMASFLSALAVALVSHTFARIFKTPVTLFLIAGILPTVPGAGMYRIVHYLLAGDEEMTAFYLMQTVEIAGVIALAIFVTDTVFRALQKEEWKQNSMKYKKKEAQVK